jgi:hypothetical protein
MQVPRYASCDTIHRTTRRAITIPGFHPALIGFERCASKQHSGPMIVRFYEREESTRISHPFARKINAFTKRIKYWDDSPLARIKTI